MLKNKTKEQILELLYQANNENFSLQLCNDKQSEILKSIANLYQKKGFFARLFNFFAMPWKILQLLKSNNEYFYNLSNPLETMELNKEQCIEAQKAILDFENQRVNSQAYKAYVTGLLGLPENCGTCGDIAGRLHDDFQKRVTAEIKAKFPELLPTPPTLESGQFSGETYYGWMQTYHFKGLVELLSRMKTAALSAKQRGALEQAGLMLDDRERLKEFIKLRKMGMPTGEETTGKVDLEDKLSLPKIDFKKEDAIVLEEGYTITGNENDVNIVEKAIQEHGIDAVSDALDAMKNEPEAAKEKKVYTDEEAYALKNSGMTLAELGVYYGVHASTIQRKLEKYTEILAAEKAKNETLND